MNPNRSNEGAALNFHLSQTGKTRYCQCSKQPLNQQIFKSVNELLNP